MPVNTLQATPEQQKIFYDRTLLTRLTPKLVYTKYAQKRKAPKNEGETVDFRRLNSLAPATTALTEGVTPAGETMAWTSVRAVVSQYGSYVSMSDKLDKLAIDPVATEAAKLMGENAGETLDIVHRDGIIAGTNVQYANGKTGRNALVATDKITSTEIFKVRRTLASNNVPRHSNNAYIGIVDSFVAFDIMNDPLWIDVSKYNGGEKIMDGEIGKLGGIRFIETSLAPVVANSANVDIHLCLIFGLDAYGVVDIAGKSAPEVIVKGFGEGEDPLNQRSSVGWKALSVAKILQDAALVRLEVAASA